MSAAQLIAWTQAAQLLIGAGIATVGQIKDIISSIHGEQLPDEQLNSILDWVVADANHRKIIAQAEARGAVQ